VCASDWTNPPQGRKNPLSPVVANEES